ncbi:undecaprenyl-phosphate galactose phosphotransferase WbaP [Deinococcus pimensis]|uniref:undecaprenyl-phosphate galactose phosphotransferase WbaP n=1 Tax=Deinococcus pimensis TaxID=309888 RepID=UPI001FE23057|nr:undecaprenyl-phosphate galactose phosphotransferase WbaP [Deinococcus pimensis]
MDEGSANPLVMSEFTDQRPEVNPAPHARADVSRTTQALPQGLALFLSDVLGALLTYLLVNAAMSWIGNPPLARGYAYVWLVIWLLLRAQQGMYPGYGHAPHTELRHHTLTTIQAALAQFAVTYAVHDFDRSRIGLGLLWLLLYFVSLPLRYLTRSVLIRLGHFGRPVSIIGGGKTGDITVHYLLQHPSYGLRPVAVYDDNPELIGATLHGVPIVGNLQEAVTSPRALHAIISIPGARANVQRDIINAVRATYVITWATPDFFGVPNQALIPRTIGTHASLEIRNNLRSHRSRFVKRLIDVVAGVLILVLITPLLLLIALAIRLDSRGPVIYRARRVGREGRDFACLKFRTMHQDAERKLGALLDARPDLREEFEATHKLRDDPRITRVGAILRRTSLDELPQLLNVLTGEMSLVGPRPIVNAEIAKYGEIYRHFTQVRPGMTGYWQVNGRSDTSYDERVEMDNFYITNWTPWLDLVILVQTVRVVLKGKGAY